MDILAIIEIIAIVVLIGFLVFKPKHKTSDFYLTLSLVLILVLSIEEFFGFAIIDAEEAYITTSHLPTVLGFTLLGPMIYFHIKHIVKNEKIPYKYVHLGLPIINGVILTLILALYDNLNVQNILFYLQVFFIVLSSVVYGIYMITFYQKLSFITNALGSNIKLWIRVIISVYLAYAAINFLSMALWNVDIIDEYVVLWMISVIISTTITIIMFYFAFKCGIVSTSRETLDDTIDSESKKWETLFSKINETVTNEHLYLNPQITINDIAKTLNSNNRYISKAVNVGFGDSFTNYINSLRLQLFKEKLLETSNAHLSIDAISLECGFNSKSAFNRFFKKVEGITPSEFRMKYKVD
ncbi:helix-turn-helix domain-containing protein [Winogradskyella sp. 3972H.M.0a.05]|uniref:helix-turn-helix domain-containing protein n=1 Tax=Winogradskyella sp. 3972H.M.0a.05 TaxID=2950277 RepID=UPI0033967E5D